jgi:LAO/AO transport system kinase
MEAKRAARELSGALRLLRSDERVRDTPVLTCSAKEGTGLDEVWGRLVEHQERLRGSGELETRRRRQQVGWTWAMVRERLLSDLHGHPGVRKMAPALEREVADGTLTPALAAERILEVFSRDR